MTRAQRDLATSAAPAVVEPSATVEPPMTADLMRRTLSHFATGVTVITGTGDDGPVGFACQSFASVSLDPPLVMFCADHRGRTWPVIREAGHFAVNVLGEHQLTVCQAFGSRHGTKFDAVEWTLSAWGAPVLADCIATIHAHIETVHTAGDHDVVIGRVVGLEVGDGREPLLFYRGTFGIGGPALSLAPVAWGWRDHWW